MHSNDNEDRAGVEEWKENEIDERREKSQKSNLKTCDLSSAATWMQGMYARRGRSSFLSKDTCVHI